LLKNPNVVKCSAKSISYNSDFKVLAVKKYKEGLPARSIFEDAGFDLGVIGIDSPRWRIKDWRKKARLKGLNKLATDERGTKPGGGRPRTKNITDTEKITRLEATVAYLKAENDFLVKLRAQRKS